MIAIVTPMSIASKSLSSANYAKDQVTAFYLAQEGIELVRSIRDNYALSGEFEWNDLDISSELSACYSSNGCMIDPTSLTVTQCSSGCTSLSIDSHGVYMYSESSDFTPFIRTIRIEEVGNVSGGNEIKVSSTVQWNDLIPPFTITNNLFDWQ